MSQSNSSDSWMSFPAAAIYGDMFYIDGLEHLEGLEVQVLIDDINHSRAVIVGAESVPGAADGLAGRVYIDFDGSEHIIGLQFTPKIASLPKIEEIQEGNDFMHEKSYTEIAVKIISSRRPIINGADSYERNPDTPQGTSEPARSELVIVGGDEWDQNAVIVVSQPLPYPLTVSAIGGQYVSNKL